MWIDLILDDLSGFENNQIEDFDKSQKVVLSIINRLVKKLKIRHVSKIAISLYSRPDIDFISSPNALIGVITIDKTFDIRQVLQYRGDERKEAILQLIEKFIHEAAEKYGWNFEPFFQVFREVRKLNYVSKYIYGDFKKARDRKHSAGIEVNTKEDGTQISIVFYNSDECLLKRVEVIKTHQPEFYYYPFLGKAKWKSNREFELTNRANTISFNANLLTGDLNLCFHKGKKSEDQLIDDLLMASSYTHMDQVKNMIKDRMKSFVEKM